MYEIITCPGYRAIGLKWNGSYQEVSDLKTIIEEMSSRKDELEALDPASQLGLSYHLRPDGFVHYSVYEVKDSHPVPEGMIAIEIPEWTYAKVHHRATENIGETYEKMYDWILTNGYTPLKDKKETYYDRLPIKHERYPIDRDKQNPHFDIYIPVIKVEE